MTTLDLKIGSYLNPNNYKERSFNRAMAENEGVYSLMSPWPGCGLGFNSFHFRFTKHGLETIHRYYRGELVGIAEVSYKWDNERKAHDRVVKVVAKTEKSLDECGNPAILRLLRYLAKTVKSSDYVVLNEGAQSVTLNKRKAKGSKRIYCFSKWTGKLEY